jgi:hypothetical protein
MHRRGFSHETKEASMKDVLLPSFFSARHTLRFSFSRSSEHEPYAEEDDASPANMPRRHGLAEEEDSPQHAEEGNEEGPVEV